MLFIKLIYGKRTKDTFNVHCVCSCLALLLTKKCLLTKECENVGIPDAQRTVCLFKLDLADRNTATFVVKRHIYK